MTVFIIMSLVCCETIHLKRSQGQVHMYSTAGQFIHHIKSKFVLTFFSVINFYQVKPYREPIKGRRFFTSSGDMLKIRWTSNRH